MRRERARAEVAHREGEIVAVRSDEARAALQLISPPRDEVIAERRGDERRPARGVHLVREARHLRHRPAREKMVVRDLVDMLANAAHASSSPWNVYVLRGDDVINAAATRGNFVFVWTGMLQAAYSDAELSSVLAYLRAMKP